MNRLQEILERLSTLGDEEWKTPGHPMNEWVSKFGVQALAQEALGLIEREEKC